MDHISKSIGNAILAGKLVIRSFTDIDTNPVPKDWTHITKVDPEESKKLPLLFPLYLQHTSAISVGGSRDVNSTNTEETFELLEIVDTPVFHEPSAAHHVTDRTQELSEFLAIPEVLNGDSKAFVGTLGEGTAYLRDELLPELIEDKLNWFPRRWRSAFSDFLTSWLLENAVFEAYIIQNLDSAAAREANVTEDNLLTPEEAAQRALAAEKHLESPVVYLEYSGTYGGDEAVQMLGAIEQELSWSRLWYGGGIGSREEALEILEAGSDTVIVGNVFHEIAGEESSLVSRLHSDLNSGEAELSKISEWITANVDVEKTSAYDYLSTIPQVDNPKRLASEYLTSSLTVRLIISNTGAKPPGLDDESPWIKSQLRRAWGRSDPEDSIPSELIDLLVEETRFEPNTEYSRLLAHAGV